MLRWNKQMVVATLVMLTAATGFALPSASAQDPPYGCLDGGGGTWHCISSYEVGNGDLLALRVSCAATGSPCPTSDGFIDVGGIIYDACDSPDHANNGGDPARDWPHCGGGVSDETVYIHDDIFGGPNGPSPTDGSYCNDLNGDGICGDPAAGEFFISFCGHTTKPGISGAGFTLVYFIDGPLFQSIDCPMSTNVIGGTSGTLTIWLTPVA